MTSTEKFVDKFEVDSQGFLVDPAAWNEEFAVATAPLVGIEKGLTEQHWNIIRFIRDAYNKYGRVPLVYVTCINHKLRVREFKEFFPTGYHRGACRLAGLSYRTEYYNFWIDKNQLAHPQIERNKVYRIDAQGFLIDAENWDEYYALNKAAELKMEDGLTDKHWQIIRYLRHRFADLGEIPSVIETCEENRIELAELQQLFPDGYHRGAIKIAGLRFPNGE
ncbi:MAG: TusE/DsrC/DsvC family sulfur relay protein [Deltaproteobacteria bacterium]|nr:TusE/DsrC/DsvC family sulfur relay protein [Deltaproteobacteria bacterium]